MAKKYEIDQSKLVKLQDLRTVGVNPYPYGFAQTNHAEDLLQKFAHLKAEEHTTTTVSVAGRIMLRRDMGKATFLQIQDQSGKIQVYLRENDLGEELYDVLSRKTDLGDIIGVQGVIFKTKMGEVTVYAKQGQLLCKSLLPMPDKFHGLKDIELKYRQRHVDMTVNPETRRVFEKRSKMIYAIRQFFHEQGFLEVETPTLQTVYGGANARPFVTHINTWNMKMFLSISPELFLKRVLVGGLEKVFTICKNFRNEDVDTTHNPEFTMLEIYQSYVDYNAMMEYLEEVYEKACLTINGTTKVKHIYNGEEVELDFKAPWKRMTMMESIKHYAGIDVSGMSEEHLLNVIQSNKIEMEGKFNWGLGVQALFEELVEPKLVQPVHIMDHPKETTPLCKAHRQDKRLIERFESFCMGMELSNGYSELNDPILQRELLEEQGKQLRGGAEEAHPMDEDFINAIEFGMPPAGRLGFGVDRMAIMLTGQSSIRDVIFFPTMKPIAEEEEQKKEAGLKSAVVVINKGTKMAPWQELNTVAHLSAAFAARVGKQLFLQDKIKTKDEKSIALNIQHAIMIKESATNIDIKVLIEKARKLELEVAEFTTEMQETTNDKKVMAITEGKNYEQIEYLGCLVFGNKAVVDELTKGLRLYS